MKKNESVTIIRPPQGLTDIDWRELWRYRELLYIFAWRDIKVRYKQTILGIAWAVFQPLLTMIIFTIFFGNLAKVPSDGVPYPIFVFTGLLFWNYFSSSLTAAAGSLIENENIIKKIYFPRVLLLMGTVVTPLVDFIFAWLLCLLLMVVWGFVPNYLGVILVPLLLSVAIITAAGVGMFLAALNVKYRDVRYILPFFIQLMMFVTPVIYPVSLVPENIRWLSYINPMAGVISAARVLILGVGSVDLGGIFLSVVCAVTMFFLGLMYFRKTERFFADIV